jgi:hypothetical protein
MKYWGVIAILLLLAGLPTLARSLTVDEILLLKENGVSEKTIQMMLENEARTLAAGDISEQPGVRTIVRPNGQPAIIYSTGKSGTAYTDEDERRKEERAWDMLRHLIVDTRKKKNGSLKKE